MNLQRAPAAEGTGKGDRLAHGPSEKLDLQSLRFGADPYLSGEAAFETVQGMQSAGVQACAKHYINKFVSPPSTNATHILSKSEQEHFRDQSSSNLADRVQHELYLHPVRSFPLLEFDLTISSQFLKAVQAGVASVMCSYSKFGAI